MDKKENNRINETYKTTLENLKKVLDVNTVIGDTIKIDNSYILPITNISLYTMIGGGEYGKINLFTKNTNLPYSIGNGSIINIKPIAFLVKNQEQDIKLINISTTDYEKILDKISNVIKDNIWVEKLQKTLYFI